MFNKEQYFNSNFEIKVSPDGRRAVGRNKHHERLERGGINVIKFQNRKRLEDNYEDAIQEISILEKERDRYYQKYRSTKKYHDVLRKTGNAQIKLWGILGLYFGLVGSAGKVLETHGPTVTILGTIAASLLYIAIGIAMAVLMVFVCKYTLTDFIRYEAHKMRKFQQVIYMIDEEILDLQETNARTSGKIGEAELSEML